MQKTLEKGKIDQQVGNNNKNMQERTILLRDLKFC